MYGILLTAVVAACAGPWFGRGAGEEVAATVEELAIMVIEMESAGQVSVMGFRNEEGAQSTATRLLDEILVSSLVRANLPLTAADPTEQRWRGRSTFDSRIVEEAKGDIVVGGRLEDQGSWVYLRLFAADRDGVLLASRSRRLSGERLQEEVDRRSDQSVAAGSAAEVTALLHLVGVRSVGGFEQQLSIEPNAILEPKDRLQIRFDVEYDCQVWAFIYSSTGDLRTLFTNQTVYSGREQFGPAENEWLVAGKSGEVYSLYFIVVRRVEEETTDLFEEMDELIELGEVDRHEGFEKLDAVVRDFLDERGELFAEVEIVRSVTEDQLTEPVPYLLEDGTEVTTRGEMLGPSVTILRALRYEVL